MAEQRRRGGQRDPELEATWRERIAAWQSSGLTARAFCREHGIGENSFYAWRRKLRVRDGLPPQTRASRKSSAIASGARRGRPAFVAVNVAPAPAPALGPQVEIVLADGTRVRVSRDAEISTITVALVAIERLRGGATTGGARPC